MANGTKNLTHMGKGRQKGVPNKTTASLKEIIAAFCERNAEEAQVLFDRVKVKHPARALGLYIRFMEFVLPKQHASEVTASVTSITFDANRPISDATAAQAAYQAILRDPTFDIDSLVFEAPAPSAAVPAPIAVIEPIAPAPTVANDPLADIEAQGVADAEARRVMWERLVK